MLTIIEFNEEEYKIVEGSYEELSDKLLATNDNKTQWIDINISKQNTVEKIAERFNIHHLTVEDILNTDHLPKLEVFDDYVFMTLKMLHIDEKNHINQEHISFVVGKGYVITFQQVPGDVFDDVRSRIINFRGYVRRRKSDYLFVRLIDAVVDQYGTILEHVRNHIVTLEVDILDEGISNTSIIKEILQVKRELNLMRSYIVPLRDALTRLRTEANHILVKPTYNYLTDIQDHLLNQLTSFDTLREMLKDLMDLHNTQLSNDMNKVMKTLTIISALFIPLTFLAGLYGMNFKYMPEIDYPYSYPILLMVMLAMTIGLIIYMRRKRWF